MTEHHNYSENPLSFISQLLRPIRPSKLELSIEKSREREKNRKSSLVQKEQTKTRMQKLRSKDVKS